MTCAFLLFSNDGLVSSGTFYSGNIFKEYCKMKSWVYLTISIQKDFFLKVKKAFIPKACILIVDFKTILKRLLYPKHVFSEYLYTHFSNTLNLLIQSQCSVT